MTELVISFFWSNYGRPLNFSYSWRGKLVISLPILPWDDELIDVTSNSYSVIFIKKKTSVPSGSINCVFFPKFAYNTATVTFSPSVKFACGFGFEFTMCMPAFQLPKKQV